MSATAELIEDGGASAAGEEFFRSPQFLEAEGVTHTLRITSDERELLAPLIVRKIGAGPERDAISPYGYPGLVERSRGGVRRSLPAVAPADTPPAPPALDPESIDSSATGLVTIFLRHTLGYPPLAGSSERNVVQIADPALPAKSRGSDRNQINKNLRNGYELSLTPGPETSAAQRTGFLAAYEQTMRRTGAAQRYFFGAPYFDRILESPRTWLALAHAPDGTVAAASIAAASDGYLHYYLSGSGDSHLRDSPMKNIVASLVELAAELGEPLNLGGGITRGDRLEEFKRGFANRELPWHSSELVTDLASYARLSAGREAGGFFPAYRA
ncbi:MAG TPA: GNAT family N-acetyltransferase [Solirubrobacterales bacterium]|nr:GNAT family N-acetyltransferase [Solirubrobacterales bacterium]